MLSKSTRTARYTIQYGRFRRALIFRAFTWEHVSKTL
uniref:Uncharacterized protein n=1 Tax=Klebsiella phage FKP3 TaxID=3231233 RepID=A0AAU8HZI0_9CAUD